MTDRPKAGRGCTHDLWPCCGEPPEETFGRTKRKSVCPECEELIQIGRQARERESESENGTYVWTETAHWWPQYYGDYRFGDGKTQDELADAMFHLVVRLTTLKMNHAYGPSHEPVLECENTHGGYEGSVLVTAPTDVRTRLNDLDRAIRKALVAAYAEGKARGRSALLQLAGGELSMADFNNQAEK